MSGFIVVKTGGKQYKVVNGQYIKVELLKGDVGTEIPLQVNLFCDEAGQVVTDKIELEKLNTTGKIIQHIKDKKKIVFRYKNKTRQGRKNGHRQKLTKLQVNYQN